MFELRAVEEKITRELQARHEKAIEEVKRANKKAMAEAMVELKNKHEEELEAVAVE